MRAEATQALEISALNFLEQRERFAVPLFCLPLGIGERKPDKRIRLEQRDGLKIDTAIAQKSGQITFWWKTHIGSASIVFTIP